MENTYSKKEIELMTDNINNKLDDVINNSKRLHEETREVLANLDQKIDAQDIRLFDNEKKLLFATEELKEHSILLSNLTGQVLAYKTDREKEKDDFIKSLQNQIELKSKSDKKGIKLIIGIFVSAFLYVLIKIGVISKDFIDFIL